MKLFRARDDISTFYCLSATVKCIFTIFLIAHFRRLFTYLSIIVMPKFSGFFFSFCQKITKTTKYPTFLLGDGGVCIESVWLKWAKHLKWLASPFNVCFISSLDSLSLWQRSLPAVRMLPKRKQLYCHSADLCLLHADGCGHCLHHAHARHGGASEEGDTECFFSSKQV